MSKYKPFRILKLITINGIILLLLVFVLNLVSGFILQNYSEGEVSTLRKYDLPNYQDKEKAKQIFKEWSEVSTKYQAFTGWTREPYKGQYTNINAEGDRVHQSRTIDSGKSRKIAVFGGSTIWGTGVADNGTIPSYLDTFNPDIEVMNYGEVGYNARQGLVKLNNAYIRGERYEYVVFYDGVNEAGLCRNELNPLEHTSAAIFTSKIKNSVQANSSPISLIKKLLLSNTMTLIRRFSANSDIDNAQMSTLFDCDKNFEKAQEIANFLMAEWKIAHDLVESKGGKFIAILQPNAFVGKPNLSHLEGTHLLSEYRREQYQAIYRLIQRLIQRLIKEENLPWIHDFTDIFNSEELFYIDHCHVSANGNLLISEKINQLISKE